MSAAGWMRQTLEFDGDAVLDATLWTRAEQLYARWCASDGLRRTYPVWSALRLSTRVAWWERAFAEMCCWGPR